MPQQDPLVVAFPAGPCAGDDLAQLGVQRRGREPAGVHVRPQRAEASRLRLAPVVYHHLVHHVEQVQLHGADRAVGDHEGAGLDPGGAQQRLGCAQPRRLDQDVGAFEHLLGGGGHQDGGVGDRGQLPREGLPGFGPPAGDPDLVELEQFVQQHDVPECGAARADVPENPRVRPGQVAGADGGHGPGPARGDQGGVHDGQRDARSRVVQGQQPELAGQPGGIVRHEVADHLDAADPGPRQVAAEHVEVASPVVVRDQVHPRLHHHAPLAMRPHGFLDRRDNLDVRKAEGVDVRPGQEPEPQLVRVHPSKLA